MTSHLEKFIKLYGRLPTERDPDYLEMLNMGKIQVVSVPIAPPGKCANCGTARQDGRNYVDIGLQLDWYGAVYFCGYCIHEIAKTVGLYNRFSNEITRLQGELLKITAVQDKGAELQETLTRTFNEVKAHYDTLFATGNNPVTDLPPSVEPDKKESSKSNTDSTEPGTVEQDSGSRRANLSSLAELLGEQSGTSTNNT